jgi:hypothetical protein
MLGDGLTGLLLAGDDNFATPDFRARNETAYAETAGGRRRARAGGRSARVGGAAGRGFAAQPAEFFD